MNAGNDRACGRDSRGVRSGVQKVPENQISRIQLVAVNAATNAGGQKVPNACGVRERKGRIGRKGALNSQIPVLKVGRFSTDLRVAIGNAASLRTTGAEAGVEGRIEKRRLLIGRYATCIDTRVHAGQRVRGGTPQECRCTGSWIGARECRIRVKPELASARARP